MELREGMPPIEEPREKEGEALPIHPRDRVAVEYLRKVTEGLEKQGKTPSLENLKDWLVKHKALFEFEKEGHPKDLTDPSEYPYGVCFEKEIITTEVPVWQLSHLEEYKDWQGDPNKIVKMPREMLYIYKIDEKGKPIKERSKDGLWDFPKESTAKLRASLPFIEEVRDEQGNVIKVKLPILKGMGASDDRPHALWVYIMSPEQFEQMKAALEEEPRPKSTWQRAIGNLKHLLRK